MTKPRKNAAEHHMCLQVPWQWLYTVHCQSAGKQLPVPSSQSNERTVLQMMSAHSSSCSSLMVSGGANLQANRSIEGP